MGKTTGIPLASRPRPTDVEVAVRALACLGAVPDADPRWNRVAAPTRRTAAGTLDHLVDGLLAATTQVATRATGPTHAVRSRPAPPSVRLLDLAATAAVLSHLLHDLGRHRAWHPGGPADSSGWVVALVTDVLVHGWDVGQALGVEVILPLDVCARTAPRAFPWVRDARCEPDRLVLAVTGRVHEPAVPFDPLWAVQVAPLIDWDGAPARRSGPA